MTRTRNAPLPVIPPKATCHTCQARSRCPDKAGGKRCKRWALASSFICTVHGYWTTWDRCCRERGSRECKGCEMVNVVETMRLKPIDWRTVSEIKGRIEA